MCVILHMSVITQDGVSALTVAALSSKTEVVVQLLKAGANVDMQNTVCQYIALFSLKSTNEIAQSRLSLFGSILCWQCQHRIVAYGTVCFS